MKWLRINSCIPTVCAMGAALTVCVFAAALHSPEGLAQAYPLKTVRFIVPSTAGAGMDFSARLFANRVSVLWKQSVVVAFGFIDEGLQENAKESGVRDVIFKAEAKEKFCDVIVGVLAKEANSTKDI